MTKVKYWGSFYRVGNMLGRHLPWELMPKFRSIVDGCCYCCCEWLMMDVAVARPHRSTMYVDAAYCYRPSSVVCLSVCLSVTIVILAKTAEPIEMPVGLWTQVYPRNHVLDGGPDLAWERAILRGKRRPIVKYSERRPCAAAMRPFYRQHCAKRKPAGI